MSLCAPLASAQSLEHEIVIEGGPRQSREEERAFKTPEAATVTSSDKIRRVAPQSMADALRESPSVSVQQTTPGQGTVYVRGLSGRAVVCAVDGVRLNMAFFRAGNNDYLGLVDPYALDSVTVVPGASSVEFGSDALGGAVLIATRLPGYRLEAPNTTYRVLQGVTSNPLGTASRFSVQHESSNWAAHAGFTYFQAGPIRPGEGKRSPEPLGYWGLERAEGEAYRAPTSDRQIGTEFEFYAADAAARRRLGPGLELVLRSQLAVRPELVRYDQITPRFKREIPQRAEARLRPMVRSMLSASLVMPPRIAFFDRTEAQLAWQRTFERRFQRNLTEVCLDESMDADACATGTRLLPSGTRATERNASDAVSLRIEAREANDSRSASLVTGVEARHDIVSSSAERLDLATDAVEAADSRYPDGSSLTDAGVFAHVRLRLLPRVHLYAGARGGAALLAIEARGGELPSPEFDETLVEFAGSFGLLWDFVDGLAWAANAARGVRSPNVEDFAALGPRAQGRFVVPNPDIEAEHSYTLDTGIKFLRGESSLQTFVFFTRYDGAIALAPTRLNGEEFSEAGDRYYHSINASRIDLYGIESSFDVFVVRPLAIFGRALAMLGEQRNPEPTGLPSETPADRAPPVQGELGVRYRPSADLEVEALAVGRARQDRLNDPVNLDDNRIPEGGTPGFVTYHARGRYVASRLLVLRLGVDNITDELVLEHGSGFYRPGFGVMAVVEFNASTSTGAGAAPQ